MEENKPTKKYSQSTNMMLVGLALLVVAIVLLILFFINGKTDVGGGFPDPEKTISTTCTSERINYPYFSMDGSEKKELNIKIISADDKIDTISLVYRLYYNSEAAITESRDVNHFAMNKAFEAVDMEPDSLGATYSRLSDNFRFNLFAKAVKLDDKTKKFFMLDNLESEDGFSYREVQKIYIEQGFECITDENKNKNKEES